MITPSIDYLIKKFLRLSGPSRFKQIEDELKKNDKEYKQRQGLIKKLNHLIKNGEIKRDKKTKQRAVYSLVEDSSFDDAIKGERFRYHVSNYTMGGMVKIDENYWKNDVNYEYADSFETKFVKTMVTRYGFFLLSIFVKSFDQAVSDKEFNRKIWMENALDILKNEEYVSKSFLKILLGTMPINLENINNKKILKSKLNKLKIAMSKLYPKLYQEIDMYEDSLENNQETIYRLKQEKEIKKNIKL